MDTDANVHAASVRGLSSLFLCMVAETLRLALCGPDDSRISAVTYYTSL